MHAVEASGATVRDNGLLGLTSTEVENRLSRALEKSGHFQFLEPTKKAPRDGSSVSLMLELPFTREARKSGRSGIWAEVGATLVIERRVDRETHRYEVVGMGEVEIPKDGDRARAMQEALELAVKQAVDAAHLQLDALRKSDRELVAALESGDAAAEMFALRALTERRNPAAAEALLKRLSPTAEPDEVRQVMGALAEMRDVRAVKPLIELTRGRDASFVREVLFALAQIGGEEAMAYLFTVAQGHDNEALRQAATTALKEVEARQAMMERGRAGAQR